MRHLFFCIFSLLPLLFPAKAQAQSTQCYQPATTGPCEGAFSRYFHNYRTGRCERFSWGGCGGNTNNFRSLAECEDRCRVTTVPGDACSEPEKIGPCDNYIPRYYYNSQTRRCQRFIYGGCAGNRNNFNTPEECERLCVTSGNVLGDPCRQPRDPGNCRAYLPRYYYNYQAGECQSFIYYGCGGNQNNFQTQENCQDECEGNDDQDITMIIVVIVLLAFVLILVVVVLYICKKKKRVAVPVPRGNSVSVVYCTQSDIKPALTSTQYGGLGTLIST